MRDKFDKIGFSGWSKYEVLEFMLYYVYAQCDTNVKAHLLLEYNNNSLKRMLENSVDNRMSEDINGIGEKTVRFLRVIRSFMEYYNNIVLTEERVRADAKTMPKLLRGLSFSDDREDLYMLCLDKNMYVKCLIKLTEASDEDCAAVSVDKVVSSAVRSGAVNVILAHNHPMGSKHPSGQDIHSTEAVSRALAIVGVFLVDHYIVSGKSIDSVRMYMHSNLRGAE